MRLRSNRIAVLAAATAVAAGTVVPLTASAAAAATPTETQVLTADTNHDGSYGLYTRATPTGPLKTIVPETPGAGVGALTASRDGSRVADLEYQWVNGALVQKLVVRDISGRLVRAVYQASYATIRVNSMALSPDGNLLVWVLHDPTHNTWQLVSAPVAGGSLKVLGNGLCNPVFLDGTTLLVESVTNPWYTMPAAGGALTSATGFPDLAFLPTVSVDGTKIAWDYNGGTSTAAANTIQVASLTVTNGQATASGATTVASGLNNYSPAFSRDGASLLFVKNDGSGGPGAVYSVPVTGGTATSVDAAQPIATGYQTIGITDDGTPPGNPVAGTATLLGTSATVHWGLPGDTDLSGVIIRRFLGSTYQKAMYVPAPLTLYRDYGLVIGSTYTYTFQTVDRSGNVGGSASHNVTGLWPMPVISTPTSATTTTAPFVVRFGPAAPPGARFTIDYFLNSSTRTHWITNQPGWARTFGAPASTGVAATISDPGGNYTFVGSAVDAYGNHTPDVWGGTRVAVVPYDQTAAYFNGGTTVNVSTAWLGSYRAMRIPGSYALLTKTGHQFMIIGYKCPTCGVFDLYDNGRLVKSVDTYSSTVVARTVLATLSYAYYPDAQHRLMVKVRGTAGRPNVIVDGFAVRRDTV